MSGNFWLTEEQFNKINPLLPNKLRGVARVDDERVLSGIIFCLQCGYRWSDVPDEYGPAKTLYNRYKRWSEAGVFERIFDTLARDGADRSPLMIDAGPYQNPPHRRQWGQKNNGDRRGIGKTKGGLNSKLHLVCDGSGRPVHVHVTAGNRADITQARQCLEPHLIKGTTVIADQGYDASHLREWLAEMQATPCIPPRKNRKIQFEYNTDLDKTRNIVERMFNRIKDWRQFSLRTFRCPETFLAAEHIAATVISSPTPRGMCWAQSQRWSSEVSPGSGDAEGLQRTGRQPSPHPRHGCSSRRTTRLVARD